MPRLFAVLALLLVGCGSGTTSRDAELLTGSSWTVERIVYANGDVTRGSGETLAFGSDGSVSVASCNTCGGRFERSRQGIRIDATRCTRRACRPDQVQLEQLVGGEQIVERDGPYLILSAAPDDRGGTPPQVLLLPSEAPR
ncbi:MAG: META domain-containing protein [Bacteroidota bacterium]